MRKTFLTILAGCLTAASTSMAGLITIAPPDPVLGHLDHYSAYRWNMNLNALVPDGAGSINSATLTIARITNNMEPEANDILRINLLDVVTPSGTSPNTVRVFTDNQAPTNFFGVSKPWLGWTGTSLVGTFSDHNGRRATNNLNFSLDANLVRSFAADNGWIGLGFDPDCHYKNRGVRLTLNVPEPESASLIYLGLLLLAPASFAVRRKKK